VTPVGFCAVVPLGTVNDPVPVTATFPVTVKSSETKTFPVTVKFEETVAFPVTVKFEETVSSPPTSTFAVVTKPVVAFVN
jgi:hypothetical protein